jgi:hypothetical protein
MKTTASDPIIMSGMVMRRTRCETLLKQVPDDAPCFTQHFRSDEVSMALAVLAGDMTAAAALADEIIAKHAAQPKKTFQGMVGLGHFRTFTEFATQTDFGELFKRAAFGHPFYFPTFGGIQSASVDLPYIRALIYYHDRQLQTYFHGKRHTTFLHTSGAAGRAMRESAEMLSYITSYTATGSHPLTYPLAWASGDEAILFGHLLRTPLIDVLGVADLVLGFYEKVTVSGGLGSPVYTLIIQDAFQ